MNATYALEIDPDQTQIEGSHPSWRIRRIADGKIMSSGGPDDESRHYSARNRLANQIAQYTWGDKTTAMGPWAGDAGLYCYMGDKKIPKDENGILRIEDRKPTYEEEKKAMRDAPAYDAYGADGNPWAMR